MTLKERFSKTLIGLLIDFPFFGHLALHLPFEADDTCQSMGTDGRNIYYGPEFVEKLTNSELSFITAHEVMHCVFKHVGVPGQTRRGDRDPDLWGCALDYVINYLLVEAGLTMPTAEHCKGLYNADYKGLNSEQVYELLLKKQQQQQKDNKGRKPGDGKGPLNKPGDGSGDAPMDDHSKHGKAGADPMLKREWEGRIAAAQTKAKLAGKDSSGIGEMVSAYLQPKVALEPFLYAKFKNSIKENYRSLPPNRRYLSQDIYLPSPCGRHFEGLIAIDSSGSVSTKELQYFLGVINRITETFESFTLTCIAFSNRVHSHTVFKTGDDIRKFQFEDRGGTLFRPVFDWVKQKREHGELPDLDMMVFLTDGGLCDSFPPEPDYPVVWVHSHKVKQPPFGQVVQLDVG